MAKRKHIPLKPSKAQIERELRESWEKMLASHSKPLERGLQAKTDQRKFSLAAIRERLQKKTVSSNSITPWSGSERVTARHQSKVTAGGNTDAITPPKYTGTLIKGIAVMHKSNAVPIIEDADAVAVASMRR